MAEIVSGVPAFAAEAEYAIQWAIRMRDSAARVDHLDGTTTLRDPRAGEQLSRLGGPLRRKSNG